MSSRKFWLSGLLALVSLPVLAQSGVSAVADEESEAWVRYRVSVPDAASAERLADSDLALFSCSVQIGETDVIVGPGEYFKLMLLGLRARPVSLLPRPDAWANAIHRDAPDYRNEYLDYTQMIAQYESWRLANPRYVTRTQIATTLGNQPVWAYRFANSPRGTNPRARGSFVITCGIHAREWISPAVGLHIAKTWLDKVKGNRRFSVMGALYPLYIVPSLNPDGYLYTWSTNRNWRKNRRNNGGGIYGVDLNRNYATGWGLNSGSSGSTGSDTYRGPSAFSERETSGLNTWMGTIEPVKGFIDFHSYSQLILRPWGYQVGGGPDEAAMFTQGALMQSAITATTGVPYQNIRANELYLASGVSSDHVYQVRGARAYTIELRDTGTFGFLLPVDQITPTQNEAYAAFERLILDIAQL